MTGHAAANVTGILVARNPALVHMDRLPADTSEAPLGVDRPAPGTGGARGGGGHPRQRRRGPCAAPAR